MIFKNPSQSANLLADKIRQENFTDVFLAYINPDARDYCQIIASNLNLPLNFLETSISRQSQIKPSHIVLLDDGSTRVGEYSEFVDYLRRHFPESNIIISLPFIPQSEEDQFRNLTDSLLVLHVEPLFFSLSQFYQSI